MLNVRRTSQVCFYKRLFKQIMYQCDYCLVVGDKAHFQLVLWDAEHYNPYFITKNGRQQLNHSEYQINIRDMDAGKYKS
ncbi:regulatory protein [Staphylococcus gallinarum]|uniref:Regulatory protein n=1 Tax=Staphylococcus gallinarum TaxID=1293 RepID=A0A380FNK4_STAGA|nr:regulatory protein [Staphylococcus gallinarum]